MFTKLPSEFMRDAHDHLKRYRMAKAYGASALARRVILMRAEIAVVCAIKARAWRDGDWNRYHSASSGA